jgi:hypothetical protein
MEQTSTIKVKKNDDQLIEDQLLDLQEKLRKSERDRTYWFAQFQDVNERFRTYREAIEATIALYKTITKEYSLN